MKSPVKEAVRLSNAAAVIVDIDDVQERLKKLNAISRTILPVEVDTPGVKEMRKELQVLRQRKQIAKYSNKGYPSFALEALTWRRDDGFPTLMCYSLDNAKTSFQASKWRGWKNSTTPEFPPILRLQYKDFVLLLEKMARDKNRIIFASSTYAGLIPLDVKEEIKNIKEAFTSIWIVAETKGWTVKELKATPPPPRDPLVIGVRGRGVYLIASYDTTDVEAMAEELSLAKVGE